MMRKSTSYGNVLASQSGWESDTVLLDGMGLRGAIRTLRTLVGDAGGFPLQNSDIETKFLRIRLEV